MSDLLSNSLLQLGIEGLTGSIFKTLGKRHSVDVKYLVDDKIFKDFSKCLEIASSAFLNNITKNLNIEEGDDNLILFDKYLKSQKVITEISKLLDPGIEIFDKGKLIQHFFSNQKVEHFNLNEKSVENAWDEFLKAFSFASRSAPNLREFLRASYEAGSFQALSNIEHELKVIDKNLVIIRKVDKKIKKDISIYQTELQDFKNWASAKQ